MNRLTSKQESFFRLMTKSDEHARRGFELLLKEEGFETFFDTLLEFGLFNASENPAPVPAREPGYFRVPSWAALEYLKAVGKVAGERNDVQLADKVLNVVRQVSNFRETDGTVRENYHTYHVFSEILGLVPTQSIRIEDLELVPLWLRGRFERGLSGWEIGKGVLPRLLKSHIAEDLEKAAVILNHCTAIEWVDDKGLGEVKKKPITVVEDHGLNELIKRNVQALGEKIPLRSSEIFLMRLREVFREGLRSTASYVFRPAIEEHDQNHSWHGPENRFVEGLRDVLLIWADHELKDATKFVGSLIGDDSEIARRVGIFVLGQRFQSMRSLYLTVVSPKLFRIGHLHELYNLLRQNFSEFTLQEKEASLKAIKEISVPSKWEDDPTDDPHQRLRRTQKTWLSAVRGKNYELADQWFDALSNEAALGGVSEHPDFLTYMESGWGFGPAAYEAPEIVAFAEAGKIVEKLNSFEEHNTWRGPTTRALVDTLENAVSLKPDIFVRLLPDFLNAKRPFQYGIINGFKKLWDAAKDGPADPKWNVFWPELIVFFSSITSDPAFWDEKAIQDQNLTANRNWIPGIMADFLQAGTRDDKNAYAPELLPETWTILNQLVDHAEGVVEPAESDAMTQAINNEKGRIVEAMVSNVLRSCRVADRSIGNHSAVWSNKKAVFDRELAKCTNANFEFSTLMGAYYANLEYIDPAWLKSNTPKIFPEKFPKNFACAVEGLAYAPSRRSVYSLLKQFNIFEVALKTEARGKHGREKIVERMVLGYLWGDDELESAQFSLLFGKENLEDLEQATQFLWRVSGEKIPPTQIERILAFWERCIEWSHQFKEAPATLLSSLSMLSRYVDKIGQREEDLLLAVAPYAHVGYNADRFIEELGRLADKYPDQVNAVLGRLLDAHTPIYDFEQKLEALLSKLAERGKRIEVLLYLERLRDIPAMRQLFGRLNAQ